MVDNVTMAMKMGYLRVPAGVLRPWDQINHLPPNQIVVVTTGSQGEPTSALVRIANQDHKDIEIIPGDTIIVSASPIPGNETVISRTIDNLCRQGANVLYARNAQVHVHGHASQEVLKMMLRLTKPKYFTPVHGEYRHLVAHAALAHSVGIPPDHTFVLENGDVLHLTSEEGKVIERVSSGNIYVDGLHLWDPKSVVLRDRQALSREGVVVVILTVNQHSGELVGEPEIVSSGFVDIEQHGDLIRRSAQVVLEALDHQRASPLEWSYVNTKVKETLGTFLYNETRRRPMILPVSVRV
ncbi:MAG: ribonuclease J [Chloroflexi bacterium]|nr:ribonuclease J [Chloroflexota bacterium]